MYETLVLIDQGSPISADDVEKLLSGFCDDPNSRGARLARSGDTITIKWPAFAIEICRNAERWVLEESAEIAARYAAGRPEQQRVSSCAVRLEISGDPDPGMDYFNDFCLLLEAIEGLGRVYSFDPHSAQFMNL